MLTTRYLVTILYQIRYLAICRVLILHVVSCPLCVLLQSGGSGKHVIIPDRASPGKSRVAYCTSFTQLRPTHTSFQHTASTQSSSLVPRNSKCYAVTVTKWLDKPLCDIYVRTSCSVGTKLSDALHEFTSDGQQPHQNKTAQKFKYSSKIKCRMSPMLSIRLQVLRQLSSLLSSTSPQSGRPRIVRCAH